MADPLSIAASIAGLLSLAGQVYTTLDTFISNVQHAPSFANCIRIEVDSFRSSLNALHTLLFSGTAPPKRAALIPADFIILTFTDATLLFSEIEAEVLPLIQLDNFDFIARSRWTRKKAQLETLVSRLQWQKLTLVLQLNILKCASENDAHKELSALTQNCMEKLANSQDLERRVELVEAQLQQNTLGDSMPIRSGSDLTVRPMGKGTLDAYPIQHEFEETLYASWVYRRNQTRRESMSIRSSVIRQSAWSALSELSLAQISIISVIALPVQRSELFNAQWYPPSENQGEEARDDRNTGKLALGSEIQPPGLSPGNQNAISCNTRDEGSVNILSKALQKANIAVLRDRNHDFPSAVNDYMEACNLLGQIADKTTDSEDRRKLENIQNTYFIRFTELMELLKEEHKSATKFQAEPRQMKTEDWNSFTSQALGLYYGNGIKDAQG